MNFNEDCDTPDALTGTVTIDGILQYGQVLSASVTGSNNTGTLSYQWKRNGSSINGATANTYTLIEDDITTLISVTISSSAEVGVILGEANSPVEKANQNAPAQPILVNKTHNSVSLAAALNFEFAVDGNNWQTSNGFNNLAAETQYSFIQRTKETATHKASPASAELTVTTNAAPNNALTGTVAITGTLQYNEELTATITNSNNTGTLSYQWKRDGLAISGATENAYTLVEEDISTIISATVSSSVEAGTITGEADSIIKKADQDSPAAPTLASKTHNSVSLEADITHEYAVNDGTWQTSNTFNSLIAETPYSFTCRAKETNTHKASPASAALMVTTNAEPVNALNGTVTINGILQYGEELTANVRNSNNTGTLAYQWKRNGLDVANATGNIYKLVEQDIATTISVTVSSSVEEGTITGEPNAKVEKADRTAPDAPTLASITHNSVLLVETEGFQYAIDGGAWQESFSFTGLTAETAYTFSQRYAETETHKASATSTALKVTTDTEYTPSDDNSLSDLTIDGKTIDGFNASVFEYYDTITNENMKIPLVAAIASDENSTIVLVQASSLNDDATIVVIAEDNTRTTYTIHFILATGINTNRNINISYFPNPLKNSLTLEFPANTNIKDVRIISITGETYIEEKTDNISTLNIKTECLRSGTYLLQVRSIDNITRSYKIIKE